MIKNSKVILVGAGGFGREVLNLLYNTNYEVVGFIDKNINKNKKINIIGNDNIIPKLFKKYSDIKIFVSIGNIQVRKKIIKKIKTNQLEQISFIHNTSAYFIKKLKMGSIIYPNCTIMNDCKIGEGTVINSGVNIGHDSQIGNYCNINPGVNLAGNVKIGNECMIGMGTKIKEGITIGRNSVVGAGSLVLKNIPPNSLFYGAPAVKISK